MESQWSDPEWRETMIAQSARTLSKIGSFCGMLASLKGLSDGELVEFYSVVRKRAGRLEPEWRHEFEDAFPGIAPPPDRVQFVMFWELTLCDGVLGENAALVGQALAALSGVAGLADLRRFHPESLEQRFPVYWGGDVPDLGLTVTQLAESIGNQEVLQLLVQASAKEARG